LVAPRAPRQLYDETKQDRVGCGKQDAMRWVIEPDGGVGGSRRRQLAADRAEPLQQLSRWYAAQAERRRVEHGAERIELIELLLAEGLDEESDPRDRRYGAFGDEPHQRFAQWSPAYAQCCGEMDFVDPALRKR